MKHHKIMRRGLSVLLSLLMCLTLLPATALAEGTSVAINGANFPDANFRAYVSENFDENKDGTLSPAEIAAVTEISCEDLGIESLEGIEYFTALTSLKCTYNDSLTKLDVSKNTALTYLDCFANHLEELDLSQNGKLTYLKCENNGLTGLKVGSNTALETLICNGNNLTSLDLSKNTALTNLDCNGNRLTKLDVSSNTKLTNLDCSYNNLTSLDLSKNTALTNLDCSDNIYAITLDETRTFDLSALPGFDAAKASDWDGGTVDEGILTFDSNVVTYKYDCGNGHTVTFTLDAIPKYTVTVYGGLYGLTAIPGRTGIIGVYAAGEQVSLPIGARDGYTLKDLTLDGIAEDDLIWNAPVENIQRGIGFTMPDHDVTVTVNWQKDDDTPETEFVITFDANGGTLTGASVFVTGEDSRLSSLPTPTRDDYTFDGWYTAATGGEKVDVDRVYTENTPLYAHWTKGVQIVNPFTDVPSGSYYEDAVIWAVSKGITSGTTKTTFSPNSIGTRAQAVTFLWNAAGKPKVSGTCAFQDISSGAWYYQAVLWAVQNNVTSGTSATTFSPKQACSRAQIVTFLYRYLG